MAKSKQVESDFDLFGDAPSTSKRKHTAMPMGSAQGGPSGPAMLGGPSGPAMRGGPSGPAMQGGPSGPSMQCSCAKKTASSAPAKIVNVGFIGYGIQARTVLVPNIIKQGNVVVKAVCDCDKTRREAGAAFVNDYYKSNKKARLAKCKAVADSVTSSTTRALTPSALRRLTTGTPISAARP